MKVNVIQPWNYRVLIADDQEEIHNDFEEMLVPSSAKRATDDLARRVCLGDRESLSAAV